MGQTLYMNAYLTRCLYDSQNQQGMDRGFTKNCGLDDGHGSVVDWIDCPEYDIDWYDIVDVVQQMSGEGCFKLKRSLKWKHTEHIQWSYIYEER